MADTGAPWNIPYAEPTDLVRDWPALSEDVAEAVADGLDAAGGLVEVKSVLKTDTFTASLGAGASTDITGLTITHALADAAHKLVIIANIGAFGNSRERGQAAMSVARDGTLLAVGASPGSRLAASTADGAYGVSASQSLTNPLSLHFVYSPPDATSAVYTLRAQNFSSDTRTVYVNRSQVDTNDLNHARTVSSLTIMEIKV